MASPDQRKRVLALTEALRQGPGVPGGASLWQPEAGSKDVTIEIASSQVDLRRLSEAACVRRFLVPEGAERAIPLNQVAQAKPNGILAESTAQSGAVTVRARAGAKDDKEIWLEVWRAEIGLVSSLKISDKTSKIYNDSVFGGLTWSVDENLCCFIGEVPLPKFKPVFEASADADAGADEKPEGEEDGKSKEKDKQPPHWADEKFVYREDFGETLEGKVSPAIFVFNLETNKIFRVQGVPEHLYPQRPMFDANGGIVFQAVHLPLKKLGLNFCLNKSIGLYHFDKLAETESDASEPRRLTPDGFYLAFNACFDRARTRLVFFGREDQFVSHSTNYAVYSLAWPVPNGAAPECVVEPVRDLPSDGDDFAGFYGYHVTFCLAGFIGDSSRYFLAQSQCMARNRIYLVDVVEHKVEWLNFLDKADGEYEILGFEGTSLVFRYWSFDRLASAHLVRISTAASDDSAPTFGVVSLIDDNVPRGLAPAAEELFTALTTSVKQHTVRLENGAEAYLQYDQAVLSSQGKPLPCLVVIHGGPFGASPRDAFLFQRNMFVGMGLAVLTVNYRGSTGFGEDFLNALLGKIGEVDVDDCANLVRAALSEHSSTIDKDRVGVYGGSHGGYLTGWLIGHPEYRSLFSCSALWNPVLCLPYNMQATDIPDWVTACGKDEPLQYAYTAEDNALFWDKSPFSVVKNVTCPALLLVGTKDLRVPPHQSVHYYYTLRSQGVDARLHTYPESGHSIANMEHNIDAQLNLALWFADKLDAPMPYGLAPAGE